MKSMRWLALILLVTWLGGCRKDKNQPPETEPVKIVISGDTGGWITPCGCTSNQSGGLLRRATYLANLRSRSPVLYLDAGGAVHGSSDYDRLKFEAVLSGERLMGVAAHNIGRAEAALGAKSLRRLCEEGYPLVSANVRDESGRLVSPPMRVAKVGTRRVAVVGVMSSQFSVEGVRIDNPQAAVLSAIGPAKGSYDTLIVLAYLPQEELENLAASLPEADVVIGGPTGQPIPPRKIGPTLLSSATNKGKFLVTIDLAANGVTTAGVVEMDATIADDRGQQENLNRFLAQLRQRDFDPSQTGLVPPLPPGTPPDYRVAGSQSCVKCHATENDVWQHSAHSHAWQTLVAKRFEVDPECVQCHSTGYGLPGGFEARGRTPQRVSVGCESCHGPSAAHVADPHRRTPFKASDQCTQCHDHENSPHFEFTSYWARILHGATTRPSLEHQHGS